MPKLASHAQSIQDFQIYQTEMPKLNVVLFEQKPAYFCGDFIRGKCILHVSDSLKLQTFYVELEGQSYAHWTTRSNKRTHHHTSKFEYFQLKQVLLVSNDATNNQAIELKEGSHEYNFNLQIPYGEVPSSFQGTIGHIRYWIKAKVVRNWAPDVKTLVDISIYSPPFYNPLIPGIEQTESKTICCLCCASEPVIVNVTLDKTGYQVGEDILITAQFRNPTTRNMTPKCKIYAVITYTAGSRHRTVVNDIIKIGDEPMTGNDDVSWDRKPLKVPPTVNSIINCPNIRVEHFVRVTLDIPNSINVHVDTPILIGLPTPPMNQQPPQFNPLPPPSSFPPQAAPSYHQASSSYQPPPSSFPQPNDQYGFKTGYPPDTIKPNAPVIDQPKGYGEW